MYLEHKFSPRAFIKASIRAVSTASSLGVDAAAAPVGVAEVPGLLLLASWAVEATVGRAVVDGADFDDDLGEAALSALPDFASPEAGASPTFLSCWVVVAIRGLGEGERERLSGEGGESPGHLGTNSNGEETKSQQTPG